MFESLKSMLRREKRTPKPKKKKQKAKPKKEPKSAKPVGIVIYRCKICGYETGSREDIRRHVRTAHWKEYTSNKQTVKWSVVTDQKGRSLIVYSEEYAASPRKTRFHLSEMYERVVIRR